MCRKLLMVIYLYVCVQRGRPVGGEGLRKRREFYYVYNFYIWMYFIVKKKFN